MAAMTLRPGDLGMTKLVVQSTDACWSSPRIRNLQPFFRPVLPLLAGLVGQLSLVFAACNVSLASFHKARTCGRMIHSRT